MRMLARADADGDGAVTREELEAAIDDIAEERRERAERHMARRFDELDEDGDGMIMRADVLEQAFYRLDSNGDGFVSEEEAQVAQGRWQQRRGRRGDGPADPS
jgi:Ca2+-binding EF-hand superfamily protein